MGEPTYEALQSYVDAALELQGLPIDPIWRDGILTHFKAIEAASRRVSVVSLGNDVEPAPVFTS